MTSIQDVKSGITAVLATPTTNYYKNLTLVEKIIAFVAQVFCDVDYYSESSINKREAEKLQTHIGELKNIKDGIPAVLAIPTTNYYKNLTLVEKIIAFVAQVFCDVDYYSESSINKREAEKLQTRIGELKNIIENIPKDKKIEASKYVCREISKAMKEEKKVDKEQENKVNKKQENTVNKILIILDAICAKPSIDEEYINNKYREINEMLSSMTQDGKVNTNIKIAQELLTL